MYMPCLANSVDYGRKSTFFCYAEEYTTIALATFGGVEYPMFPLITIMVITFDQYIIFLQFYIAHTFVDIPPLKVFLHLVIKVVKNYVVGYVGYLPYVPPSCANSD